MWGEHWGGQESRGPLSSRPLRLLLFWLASIGILALLSVLSIVIVASLVFLSSFLLRFFLALLLLLFSFLLFLLILFLDSHSDVIVAVFGTLD